MFFFILLALAIASVSAVTPSDLPECAVECYIQGVQKAGLALDDYEGQCRSAPFQLTMRGCAAMNCDYDEYLFV